MLRNDENREEMKLIDEKPIETRAEDWFKHQYYVDILKEILSKCPTPYCVGLFGRWGAGKTGIVKILETELKNESRDTYEILYFDTWKHSDDTLRRQLLIDIDEKIFRGEKKYRDILYNTTQTQNFIEYPVNWKKFFKIFAILSILLLAAIILPNISDIIIFLPYLIRIPIDLYQFIKDLLFPAILALLASLERKEKKATVTTTVEKPTSPEQFEYRFENEVLKDVRKSHKKLLIIFDNLDRCDSETVVKILKGINTFLGEKDCVYLIPCDPVAIKKHLKNQLYQRDSKTEDPDEFLRKVFQISIDIHQLIYSDIKSYAEKLINQTTLGDHPKNRQIIHIITQAFVNSPRRIKQILNNLTIRYFIARKFEIEKRIASNIITENMDFLAKIMVLKEEWPDFYDIIQKDGKIYNAVIDHLIENKNLPQMPEGTERALEILNKDKELRRFIESTKTIQNENIDLFLQFNQDPLEVIIPESKKIKDALIYRREDELVKILEDAKDDEQKFDKYIGIIELAMRNEDRMETFVNILDSTSSIIDYVPVSMRKCFSENICSFLDRPGLIQSVHSLDLGCFKIFINVDSRNQNLKRILRELAIGLIKSDTFPEAKLNALFENSQIITEELRPIVNGFFENRFKDFEADIKGFLTKPDTNTSLKFLAPSFIKNNLEGSIINKPTKGNQEVIDLYLSLKSIIPPRDRNKNLILRMIEIINRENSIAYDEAKKFAVNNLEKIKFEIPTELIEPLLVALDFMQSLIEQTMGQPQAFRVVSSIYVALYPLAESRKLKIDSKLSHLIGHEPNYYEKILNELKNSGKLQSYTDLIGFMTKVYIETAEYKNKNGHEKEAFLKMLYVEYYQEDIKYFCEHLVFDLLKAKEGSLYNFGLLAVNHFIEDIVKDKFEKKVLEILNEKIQHFEDKEENYEPMSNFIDSILVFSKNCDDKNFVDDILSNLTSNFLKSAKLVERRVIQGNFSKIKNILTADAFNNVVNNIALYLSGNVKTIPSSDPSFVIILDNQDSVDRGILNSLVSVLKSLILEQDEKHLEKPLNFLPKIKSLTKDQLKECIGDFLNIAKNEKRSAEIRELARTAIEELEPRVDKRWSEWKDFESMRGSESKQE